MDESLHTLTFSVRPTQQDGRTLRFEGIAYSGGVVPAYGRYGDVVIDLAGLQNADGDELPVLADHDTRIEAIAGKGRIYRFRGADGVLGLRIEGEVTEATESGQRIARLLADNYPLRMSVGISANFREVSGPVSVNGQTVRVSGVFEDPLIREVSFVPVGADLAAAAHVRFTAHNPPQTSHVQEYTTMSRTAEDEALIAGLQEQVRRLQAELERVRQERRIEQLAAVMEEAGRDVPQGEALKPYLEMSDAAFAAFAADLRAVVKAARPQPNPALFTSQALRKAETDGAGPESDAPTKALLAAVERLAVRDHTLHHI